MHRGRVHLESRFGEGSVFSFTIPNAAGPEEGLTPDSATSGGHVNALTPAPPGDGDLILVVEDNPTNMKLVRDLLRAQGHRVVESTTGEAALDALKFIRPHLILMDIQLPGIDGLQAASALRENPETAGIPVVALTAHAVKGDEIKARQAGCVGFIPKPIDTVEFPKLIAGFLRAGPLAPERREVWM
ncbi:MAG: response regulator [Acidobacteria bacterium]|nr:response regulator [Acidobacteriota bacterium]